MAYVLLRDDSLNISAAFGTRAEALAAIHRAVESRGREAVRGVALAHSPRGGGLRSIAADDALAELALAATQSPPVSLRSSRLPAHAGRGVDRVLALMHSLPHGLASGLRRWSLEKVAYGR